jgi:transcriptional regulator with XRE-family HTH domain
MGSRLLTSPTVAGSLVLSARLKSTLSQRELARNLGVAQSVVAAYESGRRQPTLPTLMRILAAAGFDLRLALAPHEDHDEVLEALEHKRPLNEQKRWRDQQTAFVAAARAHLEQRT